MERLLDSLPALRSEFAEPQDYAEDGSRFWEGRIGDALASPDLFTYFVDLSSGDAWEVATESDFRRLRGQFREPGRHAYGDGKRFRHRRFVILTEPIPGATPIPWGELGNPADD